MTRIPAETPRRLTYLRKLREEVIGLDTEYTLASGKRTRRIYLDSTATTLCLKLVRDVLDRFQPHYASTHSLVHFAAQLSTREYAAAHATVLEFLGADPERYTAFFVGSGTTAGVNRVARVLKDCRPRRDVVICSMMEHHSNDLPHRKHFREVVHVPTTITGKAPGAVDLERLEAVLRSYGSRVNYVALTAVSNVTGIVNPIHEAAALVHRYEALLLIDGAQVVAHLPVKVSGHPEPARDIDILVFSGHKVYAPGSPGVVVARKDLLQDLEPQEVGGGVVEMVYINRYTISRKFPDREEAGTPNVCGAVALAAALSALAQVGMDLVAEEERALMEYALARLLKIDDVIVYGETDFSTCPRVGAIALNVRGLDHGLVAAVLNDYFNIATRNECFCAHPYVRDMIIQSLTDNVESTPDEELQQYVELRRGMVRASFGIYTTREDVDCLVAALRHITENQAYYESQYLRQPDGNYRHKRFRFDDEAPFSTRCVVDELLAIP